MTLDPLLAFRHPQVPHVRRHGPSGYKNLQSYRDWLRDEFEFRCLFCLRRETWSPGAAVFEIDHIIPKSQRPDLTLEYDNLAYLCAGCNVLKNDHYLLDPSQIAIGECLKVELTGEMRALNTDGDFLIQVLKLNDPDWIDRRKAIFDVLAKAARAEDRETFNAWLGYPQQLPDLSEKIAPKNSRPNGIEQSCFAQHQAGKLPDFYG